MASRSRKIPSLKIAARLRKAAEARVEEGLLYLTPASSLTPTPKAELDKLEKAIDAKLPPLVRELYGEVQEFAVAWQEKPGSKKLPGKHLPWNKFGEAVERARDVTVSGGAICIPPTSTVFRKGYWLDRIVLSPETGEDVEFDGRKVSEEAFYHELYPFDFVSSYYTVALWFDRQKATWRVVLGSDYGADWTGCKSLSVEEYFEQLEAGLGLQRKWKDVFTRKVKQIVALPAEPPAPPPSTVKSDPTPPRFFERKDTAGRRQFWDIRTHGEYVKMHSGTLNAKGVPQSGEMYQEVHGGKGKALKKEYDLRIEEASKKGFKEVGSDVHQRRLEG